MPKLLFLLLVVCPLLLLQAQTTPLYSAESIENHFSQVPYRVNLQVGTTEISNASYAVFLNSWKEVEQGAAYQPKETLWNTYLPNIYQNLEEQVLFEQGHPNAPSAPVQNITKEAAEAYCVWLTEHYNGLNNNEKYYSKVLFRLPTTQEWELAASTLSIHSEEYKKLSTSKYNTPWTKESYLDKRKCIKANFNMEGQEISEMCTTAALSALDGAFFSVSVKAYGANALGLYNIVGNVAEMVQEEGIAKGGSWWHSPESAVLSAEQQYDQAAPYVGFRIFMEILEEPTVRKVSRGIIGPPGTFFLANFLFMDEAEVSNINWMEYKFWTKIKHPQDYRSTCQDTSVWLFQDTTSVVAVHDGNSWSSVMAERLNLVYYYHNHPAYMDYPVVGISHEQATAYCQWRTDRVNEMLALHPKKAKKYGKILYRLPTEEEWEYAAQGCFNKRDFPYGYEELVDRKGRKVIHLNWSDQKHSKVGEPCPLKPSKSMMPNSRGYYNMIGNAAEMIDQPNVAKGGSWQHPKEESKITQQIVYEEPTAWLGFRCICEIYH